jgi:tetratricopeptide (TPR) repeat protein
MRRAIVVLFLVCAAATAFAQSKHELARAHYKAGAAYYQRGKYVDAIREFEQSYELSRKPEILYNLAQCHDKLGQRDKVAGYLRRYLKEKPKAEDREQVEAWLGHLEKALADEKAAADKAAAERRAAEARAAADKAAAQKAAAEKQAAEKQAAEARAAADRAAADKAAAEKRAAAERAAARKAALGAGPATGPAPKATDAASLARARREAKEAGSTWRVLGDVGIGLGIVTVISSAVPAVLAYSKASSLEDKLKATEAHPDPVFTESLQNDYQKGPMLDKLFIGLAVTGAVIVVAGAISLWYGKKQQRKAEARLLGRPGATGANLAWRF